MMKIPNYYFSANAHEKGRWKSKNGILVKLYIIGITGLISREFLGN